MEAGAAQWTWGYDSAGEVTSADDRAGTNDRGYLFDAIGNRRGIRNGAVDVPVNENGDILPNQGTLEYTANPLNQYDTIGSASPVHDFDGNLTEDGSINNESEDRQLIWDAENRLIAVNKVITRDGNGVITDTTLLVSYQYDHLSRLISRTESSATTTLYIYDGWNRIAEYSDETTGLLLQKSYLWGMDLSGTMQGAGGIGGLLAVTDEVTSANPTYYPTFDGNGNISEYLQISGSTVTVAAHFEYDPFGNAIGTPITNGLFNYRFSTKPLDPDTGLYYYGYRWFDPLTGRWPSRDPIGERGGLNLYCFVGNDGINWWDFLGLEEQEVPGEADPELTGVAPWNKPGGSTISRELFEKWLIKIGKGDKDGKLSLRTRSNLHRGCVGVAAIFLQNVNTMLLPEQEDGIKCYLTQPEAVKHECPDKTRKQIFGKQGIWNPKIGGLPPKPNPDGTVRNDAIVGLGLNLDVYNYVTRLLLNNGKIIYVWMNHSIHEGAQTITFSDGVPESSHYPKSIWCVKCVPCTKGHGKEIAILP